ncbi:IS5 family transposase [Streptomyces sp. cg28]|uniref:IS5 family transposase n=1 Tax=Streptomyces sp. cg28 TaxID=3403457 RepID=UPI003B21DC2C
MMGYVSRRYELTDEEWELLQPFLPAASFGRPRADDRMMLNGIVWKIRAGAAWRDVPARYGPWQSLYTRFRRWALDGTFTRMLAAVQAGQDAKADVDWLVAVDSTLVRTSMQQARKKGPIGGRTDRSRPRPIPRWIDHQDPPRL